LVCDVKELESELDIRPNEAAAAISAEDPQGLAKEGSLL
jgi:hypothetical protein